MTVPDGLHLSEKHLAMVEVLLEKHLPGVEVWAYGSRVNGRSHSGSDLDLVLRREALKPIDPSRMRAIAEAFRESNIPFIVDAHDWATLPDSFHAEILRNHVVLLAGDFEQQGG